MDIAGGTLYVVSTPIGNLGDLTLRAVEVLRGVDAILAEDTRVTSRLLAHLGISKKLISFHESSEQRKAGSIVEELEAGCSYALVSDAGTPLLSDPGYRLVRICRQRAVPVVTIPGASSVTAALSISGLPTDRVLFVGFLPRTDHKRSQTFKLALDCEATLVFFESPNRIVKAIGTLAEFDAEAELFIGRELTKLYEQCFFGRAADVLKQLEGAVLKGEFVGCVSFKRLSKTEQ